MERTQEDKNRSFPASHLKMTRQIIGNISSRWAFRRQEGVSDHGSTDAYLISPVMGLRNLDKQPMIGEQPMVSRL